LARLRDLVVVIPGIGGSVLAAPGSPAAGEGGGKGGVRFSTGPATVASALMDPGRLDLDRCPDLVPSALVRGFTGLAPLVTLPGYRRLVQHLENSFDHVVTDTCRPSARVREDADVLLFPYDFRRSVADAAARLDDALGAALEPRRAAGRGRTVIVVAHSMGGLVARYWAGVLGGWKRCRALLLLGTPHRGAPKALDWLVNGAGVGPLRHPAATRVIRGWPSVYELLPQYEAVLKVPADGSEGRPTEFTAIPAALAARADLAGYVERFAAMAAAGRAVHERIAAAWAGLDPDQAPPVVSYLGRGHATLNLAVLASGTLGISKADPPWRGNVGWRGDGTVPMLSAIPREQGDRPDLWRVLPERHGPLGSAPEPVELIGLYQGNRVPVRGGELPDRPWLGLDAEEFAQAGAEYLIGVALLPAPLPGETAWVTRTPLDGTSGGPWRDQLTAIGPGEDGAQLWQGVLPGCGPGRYELAVEVTGVPGPGRVTAKITVVVLAAEAPGGAGASG